MGVRAVGKTTAAAGAKARPVKASSPKAKDPSPQATDPSPPDVPDTQTGSTGRANVALPAGADDKPTTSCTRLDAQERRVLEAISLREGMTLSGLMRVALVEFTSTYLDLLEDADIDDMMSKHDQMMETRQDRESKRRSTFALRGR